MAVHFPCLGTREVACLHGHCILLQHCLFPLPPSNSIRSLLLGHSLPVVVLFVHPAPLLQLTPQFSDAPRERAKHQKLV